MSEQRPLHRLFGLTWSDFFQGSPIAVETERDLSQKQQFVDLVLVRQGPGPIPRPLPDGFEDLAAHNLVTFKSHQEALDGWALCELVAHYVNYRKQTSPALDDLLPETDFRLLAVCVRHPNNLAQQVELTPIRDGVFEVRLGIVTIRVIVVNRLPQEERNARLLVFSPQVELLRYGQEHYRPSSPETSTLLYQLFKMYREDPNMVEELKDFVRRTMAEMLKELPPEKRLEGLSPKQRLEGLSPDERLEGLSPDERLEGLSPEERLEGLSAEELRAAVEAAQRRLQGNGSSGKSE
jgi:hypothetical protein